jgi:hypothetical protein
VVFRAGVLGCGLLVCFLVTAVCLDAAQLKEARVTHVVKDVKLLSSLAAPHPAALNDSVRDGDAIHTGLASRGELTLPGQTIARLGATTIVTFSEGTRTMSLDEGAMLFQIPRGVARAKIKTGAIALVSTGATGIIERHAQSYIKLLVLEGTVRCYLANQIGESLLVQPGQILITKPDVTALPDPAHFDIAQVMKTCLLVREFPPLSSQHLIESEEQKQLTLITKGTYIPSNLVIFGRGTLVSVVNPPPTPPPKPQANTGN